MSEDYINSFKIELPSEERIQFIDAILKEAYVKMQPENQGPPEERVRYINVALKEAYTKMELRSQGPPEEKEISPRWDPYAFDPPWLSSLANQPGGRRIETIHYIPIPLEEINKYLESNYFVQDGVKTIATIGILIPMLPRTAELVSLPGFSQNKIILAMDILKFDYLYPKNSEKSENADNPKNAENAEKPENPENSKNSKNPVNAKNSTNPKDFKFTDRPTMLRHAWQVVKVFGYLEPQNGRFVLLVDRYNRVEDVNGAVIALKLESMAVRRRISLYSN